LHLLADLLDLPILCSISCILWVPFTKEFRTMLHEFR
jgi:hypothetical protein